MGDNGNETFFDYDAIDICELFATDFVGKSGSANGLICRNSYRRPRMNKLNNSIQIFISSCIVKYSSCYFCKHIFWSDYINLIHVFLTINHQGNRKWFAFRWSRACCTVQNIANSIWLERYRIVLLVNHPKHFSWYAHGIASGEICVVFTRCKCTPPPTLLWFLPFTRKNQRQPIPENSWLFIADALMKKKIREFSFWARKINNALEG